MSVLKSLRVLARYNVLTSVAVLSSFVAAPAFAQDQTVAAGQIDNDGVVVTTGFGLTNNGTITNASGLNAVQGTGFTFVLNASGATIVGVGANSGGIRVLGTTTVKSIRNDGTISGEAFGIGENSGAIIESVVNTGTITTGTNGFGFTSTDGGTSFNNSGTISGGQRGVSYNNAPVLNFANSGTVSGSVFGVSSFGTGQTFVNTGSISSAGTAVIVGSFGSFVNSGSISGGTKAIEFVANLADRLTLRTGSEIRGLIDFKGGTDTLDFSEFYGTTVVTTTGLENIVAGDRAFVASGGNATVTIFDQTGASSMGSVTTGAVGSIQTAIANELGGFSAGNSPDDSALSGFVAEPRQTSAQAATNEAVLSDLDVAEASNGKVWGTVFGGVSGDAAPVSLTNVYGGLVAGTHFQVDASTRLGGLVGYSMSKFNVANGQQVIDSQTGVLGVYGKTDLGMIALNYALLGGGSGHSSSRKVVVGAALENVTASFASWFINPSLGISIPVLSDDTSVVNVAASASYIYGGVGSYTESSANFSANVGAMPISVFEARLELNGEKIVGQTEHGDVRLRGKIGALAEVNMGSSNIPLTLNGTATTFANPGTTTYGAYAGAGLSADIGAGFVLDAGLDLTARADGNSSATGKMSLIGSF